MALTQKLLLRQSQALVMTPQLMQAIKLLQLSHLDLASYVDGDLERNPRLKAPADEAPPSDEAGAPGQTADEAPLGDWAEERLETTGNAIEEQLDTDLNNVFPDEAGPVPPRPNDATVGSYSEWAGVGPGGRADGDANLEAFV